MRREDDGDEEDTRITLTARHIRLLVISIAAIAGSAFLMGYFSGGKGQQGINIAQNQGQIQTAEQQKEANTQLAVQPLDGAVPQSGVSEKKPPANPVDNFSFTKTLDKETPPVVDPLPTAATVAATKPKPQEENKEQEPTPAKPEETKKPSEPKQEKKEVKEVKKEEKPKTPEPPAKTKTPATTTAPAPAEKAEKHEPPAKPVATETEKTAAPAAGRAPEGKPLTIQVGAYPSKTEADKLVARLSKKNFAYVQPFTNKGATWYRVRVGVYHTETAANRALATIKNEDKLSAFIVPYN